MKQFTILLAFLIIYCSSKCQDIKKIIIGTWSAKEYDARSYSQTDGELTFKDSKIGVWHRVLNVSDNSIICTIVNPFKWTYLSSKKISLTTGKTTCNCKASQKKFENGLTEFVENLKAVYNGELFEYKVTVSNNNLIYFDKLKLERKN
jgi:hypothetical protein